MTRLGHLDALRGIAAVIVVFYHYFGATYASVLPYGAAYSDLLLVKHGPAGVKLFFMISGFVILMSLEKTRNYPIFLYKRWLRLFPAMLLASILIFAVRFADRAFVNDPPGWQDLIPGITFIAPPFLNVGSLHALEFSNLDDVFWTLYTEVSFYALFGCVYFWLGRKVAITALILIALALNLGPMLLSLLGAPAILLRPFEPFNLWLNWDMFGWFAAGALFYWASEMRSRILCAQAVLVAAGALGLAILQMEPGGPILEEALFLAALIALFALAIFNGTVQRLLDNRLLVFFGFISYPLYLVHCNVGLIQINALYWLMPGLSPLILAGATFGTMVWISYVIAVYGEPAVRRLFVSRVAAGDRKGAIGSPAT